MSDSPRRAALLRDYREDDLTDLLGRALKVGLDFRSGRVRDQLVLRHASVAELIDRFSAPLPESGISDEALVAELTEAATWSIAQADPRYLAFPDTGDSVAGIAAEIVASFLNQNLIAFDRSAPAASVIEAQLIAWLRGLIGFPTQPLTQYRGLESIGGMWTSGGNMSNHVAIAIALAHAFPDVRRTGLVGLPERPVILLASGVEHFSYRSAAQVLGLGEDGLIWADPGSDFTSDSASIEHHLAHPPPGTRIIMVVGVAGNCRTTGLDDLNRIAAACEAHGTWYHVDACHGGSLLFSKRLRCLVEGIERADSVSLDPHKGLFTTYPSSYVLFRDPTRLALLARYPDKTSDAECLDLGLITPFYGSRGFESLKLWALLRHQGREGIARLVEARHRTFQQLTALLDRTGYFQMLGTSDFYRCAFVFCPQPAVRLIRTLSADPALHQSIASVISTYTAQFCDRLYRGGEVVFDLFALQDLGNALALGRDHKYQVMGMCVGHPEIDSGLEAEIEKNIGDVGRDLVDPMLAALRNLSGEADLLRSGVDGPAGW